MGQSTWEIIVFGTISFVWISLHFNNIQNALLFVSLHHKVISKLTLFNQTRIFNIKILEYGPFSRSLRLYIIFYPKHRPKYMPIGCHFHGVVLAAGCERCNKTVLIKFTAPRSEETPA